MLDALLINLLIWLFIWVESQRERERYPTHGSWGLRKGDKRVGIDHNSLKR